MWLVSVIKGIVANKWLRIAVRGIDNLIRGYREGVDVKDAVKKALEDGRITADEIRKIRDEFTDVLDEVQDLAEEVIESLL